jgi:hypothetical protein
MTKPVEQSEEPTIRFEARTGPAGATPAGAAGLNQDQADWYARFRAQGQADRADGHAASFDLPQLTTSVRGVVAHLGRHADVAGLLARKGLDAAFFGAGEQLLADLESAHHAAPPDLRNLELLSPAQKQVVEDAGHTLQTFRDAVKEAAKSRSRREDAKVFVQGPRGTSAEALHGAIRAFLAQVPHRAELVADAGLGPEEVAQLESYVAQLQGVLDAKTSAKSGKSELSTDLQVPALALESYFKLLAARASLALVAVPAAREAFSALLPRSTRSHHAAPATPAAPARATVTNPG